MMSEKDYIYSFSDYLFWDADRDTIDLESNAPYVVKRVLELGQMKDWIILVSIYGIPRISQTAKKLRTLEPKALSFIAAVSSTPKAEFRCYTTKQSSQVHWNF